MPIDRNLTPSAQLGKILKEVDYIISLNPEGIGLNEFEMEGLKKLKEERDMLTKAIRLLTENQL